jgi:hypothetical protein
MSRLMFLMAAFALAVAADTCRIPGGTFQWIGKQQEGQDESGPFLWTLSCEPEPAGPCPAAYFSKSTIDGTKCVEHFPVLRSATILQSKRPNWPGHALLVNQTEGSTRLSDVFVGCTSGRGFGKLPVVFSTSLTPENVKYGWYHPEVRVPCL